MSYQEAQADSCFRISSMREFLSNRNAKYLRLVEYHTSGLRSLLSSFGEVHFTKSDSPEVVLARCEFLMGLGKGEFNIFTQNCEHAAHWCKTGEQWCKQTLTQGKGKIPFEDKLTEDQVDALNQKIDTIKELGLRETEKILDLSGSLVYLCVNQNEYLQLEENSTVRAVSTTMDKATAFQLSCYTKGYNCVKISLYHPKTNRYMYSRHTLSCFRDVRMKTKRFFRSSTGLKWEFTSTGLLVSMNQHRRYLGVRHDRTVVDVSCRGDAARFSLIAVDQPTQLLLPWSSSLSSSSRRVTLPLVRQSSSASHRQRQGSSDTI